MTQSDPIGRPAAQPEAVQASVHEEQRERIRLQGMAVISYAVTLLLVFFFYRAGMLPLGVVIAYAASAIAINLAVFGMFYSNLNLKFFDPNLAFTQLILSVMPSLLVLYFLEEGQARGVMLMLAVVPVTYGVMLLGIKSLMLLVALMLGSYLASLWLMHATGSPVHIGVLEALQLLAVVLVTSQVVWLGSHMNRLRREAVERNRALNTAMNELHQAMQTIQTIADRDELTGLYNRRYLQTFLAQEVARHQRTGEVFSLCLLDIDHFKQINDGHGHEAGDRVLRAVAESVQSSLRSLDCFGRFGGEEFLLILPQTELAGAAHKAERIRMLIEGLSFPELNEAFCITVSVGVAEFDQEAVDETVRRADAALYEAKRAGRNRIMARTKAIISSLNPAV